jgi:serine/threonine protein phosphatase PrpC
VVQLLGDPGGATGAAHPEIHVNPLGPGDVFLFCTNGACDALSTEQLAEVFAHAETIDESCNLLTAAALDAGIEDDATIVVVRPADGRG